MRPRLGDRAFSFARLPHETVYLRQYDVPTLRYNSANSSWHMTTFNIVLCCSCLLYNGILQIPYDDDSDNKMKNLHLALH